MRVTNALAPMHEGVRLVGAQDAEQMSREWHALAVTSVRWAVGGASAGDECRAQNVMEVWKGAGSSGRSSREIVLRVTRDKVTNLSRRARSLSLPAAQEKAKAKAKAMATKFFTARPCFDALGLACRSSYTCAV